MSDKVIDIPESEIRSLSVVKALLPWRELLASNFGTTHGNASLQTIDVLIVMLAGFFNPMVRSQRLIDALSSQQWMQDQAGVSRIARSTLSDALKRFDADALRPLVEQLVARIPALKRRDADLAAITKQLIAADGTYFNLAGEVAWALRGTSEKSQSRVRLNLQLDIETFTPIDGDISGGDDGSEPAAFMRLLKPDAVYVVDRNFNHFGFLNAVLERNSHFVVRLKKNTNFDPQTSQDLCARDAELNVRRDEIGTLPGPRSPGNADCRSYTAKPPTQTLRRVTVWDERNQCELTLLTDMLDVPAFVIAALYQQRWQIELFFKWLKCYARVDHLISHHANGITLQVYIAIIATLLLYLCTGRKPSKYTYFWLASVAAGQATWEQMQEGLARIERERELDRARRARKKLAAKSDH